MGVDLVQQYDPEAEASNFDQVPPGTYDVQIIDGTREPISKTKECGDCLSLCWQVTSGDFEGRLIFQRLNLWWDGPEKKPGEVRKIANAQFAQVREATGVRIPNNTDDLYHIPCVLTVGPQKNNPEYNEVKKVAAAGGNVRQIGSAAPRQGHAAQAAPAAANNSGGARAPWPRKTA